MKGSRNSLDVEFLLDVLHGLILDIQQHNPSYHPLDAERDYLYCVKRTRAEGISFLTTTLPQLDEALLRGLEDGQYIRPTSFKGFGALPLITRGLLRDVFDDEGMLVSDPDTTSIKDIRQLYLFFKKAEVSFSERQLRDAQDQFVDTDNGLPDLGSVSKSCSDLLDVCKSMLERFFKDFSLSNRVKHGPGAVACGARLWDKYQVRTVYRHLEERWPVSDWFYANDSDLIARISDLFFCDLAPFGVSRMVAVPKDSRGPRLIAAEPKEYQFFQQALMADFVEHVEKHPITRHSVRFADQSVNGSLALSSSRDRKYATVDMSEASDRVSVALLERIMPPNILELLESVRCPSTQLLDGSIHYLKKYATMGSALCFPVEAIVFYFLCRAAHWSYYGHLRSFNADVFGDDLVIDTWTLSRIKILFPELGLKINEKKSFVRGHFRESCGVDAYNGSNVTPLRLRKIPANGQLSGDVIASLVATQNLLWEQCYYRTAQVIVTLLERKLKRRLPLGLTSAPYLCRSLPRSELPTAHLKYNKRKCGWEVYAPVLSSSKKIVDTHGPRAALEYLRKLIQGWAETFRAGEYTVRHSGKITWRRVTALS